jgi:uncharacterized membrane protein
VAVAVAIAPKARGRGGAAGIRQRNSRVHAIIAQRCATCHSAHPTQPGFATAPAGMMLDTERDPPARGANLQAGGRAESHAAG